MRIILIFLMIFNFAFADHNDKYENKEHFFKDLSYLHLKNDQKKYIQVILINAKKRLKNMKKLENSTNKTLKKLFLEDDFDEEEASRVLNIYEAEEVKLHIDTLKKIHKILNNEQRRQFSRYLKEWEFE
ncbi:hypothetical protein FJR45_08575 [Sulfurimonas sediminis]|uniref:Periplasmic heavy metal sensor n=1 Tax=Sulfurimonas sediminis TaxID=2590020 RepID=A0A7M1B2N7_9BACT|nr:Spy/CpxP family protein refolding chaperone [Sulfurimonas sediminis]QOP43994.1 hypothetical protein FJR45_08575 [Sulfurimonas sediminis]